MSTCQDVSPAALLTGALVLFAAFAIPSDSLPVSFSEGRVWLALLGIGVLLIAVFLSARTGREVVLPLVRRPHNALLLAWLVSITLSAFFSPDPAQAFQGSTWGQMGVLQFTLIVVLFITAQTVTLAARHWRVLSFGVGLLLAVALLEALGLRPLFWLPKATAYPAVTVGQRGHLAGLFALIAGVALSRHAFPTFLMAGLGIVLCNNTSALLGYVMVGLVFLVFWRRWSWPLILSLCVTAASFLAVTKTDVLCSAIGITTCITVKNAGSDNAASLRDRLVLWRAGAGMFRARPILGWGDEQYAAHWPDYLPAPERERLIRLFIGAPVNAPLTGEFPAFAYTKEDGSPGFGVVNLITPHNTLVQEFQSHGLLGFSLLAGVFMALWRRSRLALLSLTGYGIYLLAWFSVFAVLPLAALLAGTLCRGGNAGPGENVSANTPEPGMPA